MKMLGYLRQAKFYVYVVVNYEDRRFSNFVYEYFRENEIVSETVLAYSCGASTVF